MSATLNDSDKPYAEEGYKRMGAVFEVHKEMGGGLLEEIYQQSLDVELEIRNIPFTAKEELSVFYKNRELKTRYIPDLLVSEHLVAELKSVTNLLPEHEAQLMNYMRITRQPVGYLVNFAPIGTVEWKRFVLSEFV